MIQAIYNKLLIGIVLFFPFICYAQVEVCNGGEIKHTIDTVKGEVFLRGCYVQVGISPCGTYGASGPVPKGFNSRSLSGSPEALHGLGFVANPQKNEWRTFYGDYFLPADPFEGWGFSYYINSQYSVEYDEFFNSNPGKICNPVNNPIKGSNKSALYIDDNISSTWESDESFNKFKIIQTTFFNKSDLSFRVMISITNRSGYMVKELYYARFVDPDQGRHTTSNTHDTYNSIDYTFTPDNKSLVSAGSKYIEVVDNVQVNKNIYLGLGTKQKNSRPIFLKSRSNPLPMKALYEGDNSKYIYSGKDSSDISIGLVFKFDSLDINETICFSYTYILSEDELEKSLDGTSSTSFAISDVCTEIALPKYLPLNFQINGFQSGLTYNWKFGANGNLIPATGPNFPYTFSGPETEVPVTLSTPGGSCFSASETTKRFRLVDPADGLTITTDRDSICNNEFATLTADPSLPAGAYEWYRGSRLLTGSNSGLLTTRRGGTFQAYLFGKGCKGAVPSNQVRIRKYICPPEPPCGFCLPTFRPLPGKTYIVSAWVKEDYSDYIDRFHNAGVKVNFYKFVEGGDGGAMDVELDENSMFFTADGPIVDGWQRIEGRVVVPARTIAAQVELRKSEYYDIYYDDLRIFPVDGSMQSWVYDPVTLKLVAGQDENNYSDFYEYDDEGRLIRVKVETERGVSTVSESSSTIIKK